MRSFRSILLAATCVATIPNGMVTVPLDPAHPCYFPPYEFVVEDWPCQYPDNPPVVTPPACSVWRVTDTSCVVEPATSCDPFLGQQACFMGHCTDPNGTVFLGNKLAYWFHLADPGPGECIMATWGRAE